MIYFEYKKKCFQNLQNKKAENNKLFEYNYSRTYYYYVEK